MNEFKYMAKIIHNGFSKVKRVDMRFFVIDFSKIYEKYWNPINYSIVGAIGVLINYLVFAALIGGLPWWITNAIAILTAFTWNWSMSVGPLGYLWGFDKRGGE